MNPTWVTCLQARVSLSLVKGALPRAPANCGIEISQEYARKESSECDSLGLPVATPTALPASAVFKGV